MNIHGVSDEIDDTSYPGRSTTEDEVLEEREDEVFEESVADDEEEAEECFVSKFMGDHERALLLTAQNFILDKDDSIKPITSMLRFPL